MTKDLSSEKVSVQRRTILKGASWSVPVMAAAIAVPSSSASADCPCFVPDSLGQNANFSVNEVSGGVGKVVYNSGFGIDATQCTATSQTYQVTVLAASLTMSTGQAYSGSIVSGGTTNNSFANAHGAVPANFLFTGVSFPDGNYSSIGGGTPPTQPKSLLVTVQFDWDGQTCVKTLNYDFSMGAIGTFSSGQVSGGTAIIGVSYNMTMVGL